MIYRELGLLRINGKHKRMAIFWTAWQCRSTKNFLEALNRYHKAIKSYRYCDWCLAEMQLKTLKKITEDEKYSLIALYIKRITQF